jgi:1-deoxy-D-xylulose 5-phosphate reductoisomerase
VAAFLEDRLSWHGIAAVIEATLERYDGAACVDVDALLRADGTARIVASGIIESMSRTTVDR